MLITEPLPFIRDFIDQLNNVIKAHFPDKQLSRTQRYWLAFAVMSIILTNSVCWARFSKAGHYSIAAVSWIFRKSKIPWQILLQMSVGVILSRHGIREGYLVIDDTDKKRSKSTKRIAFVHKIKLKPVVVISWVKAWCFWFWLPRKSPCRLALPFICPIRH